jgi:hypothetical protein
MIILNIQVLILFFNSVTLMTLEQEFNYYQKHKERFLIILNVILIL